MTTLAYETITAADTWTPAVQLEGYFNVSIRGTFVATVTVQRSVDPDLYSWDDVDWWTTPSEEVGFEPEFMFYRIGVKNAQYTSGTIIVRIGREDKDKY